MIFTSGLTLPEGPVALEDGSWLVVEGGRRGCVTRIEPYGGSKHAIASTGEPNGLAIDKNGVVWVADTRPPALIRLTLDGKFERVFTHFHDEPFVYPNDLCFGSDGRLYMTDSGIAGDDFAPDGATVRSDYRDLEIDGRVYRVDPGSLEVEKLDTGLKYPNGIAFGPDLKLYVNETITGAVYRYPWKDGEIAGPREVFGNVIRQDAPPGFKGPDGMAFGADGKLYVAVYGQGDVTVLGKDGSVIRRIATQGTLPTNVAFGLGGEKKLYVTEYQLGQVEMFDVESEGLNLWA